MKFIDLKLKQCILIVTAVDMVSVTMGMPDIRSKNAMAFSFFRHVIATYIFQVKLIHRALGTVQSRTK